MILVFIASVALEYVLVLFNKQKIVYVVSERAEDISNVQFIVENTFNVIGATFGKHKSFFR